LLASHHGAISFFGNSHNTEYYTGHLSRIKPDITVISVGKNPHGHPDKKAVELYRKHSTGSDQKNKIFRTDNDGNIKIELKGKGAWRLPRD